MMFSEQQLKNFKDAAGKRRISQTTFDDAVKENMEEFDMELEEAIESTVEEFKAQGVDLSTIYVGKDLQSHPIRVIALKIRSELDRKDVRNLEKSLQSLREQITRENEDELKTILVAANICATLTPCLRSEEAVQVEALSVLSKILVISPELRKSFRESGGSELLALDHDQEDVLFQSLLTAAAMATKDETGKGDVMAMDPAEKLLKALQKATENSGKLIEAVASVIISLTSADDESQPGSSAFANARQLAKEGVSFGVMNTLEILWKTNEQKSKETYTYISKLCICLKQLAANDEICRELTDAGILVHLSAILDEGFRIKDTQPQMLRGSLVLYRQMVASDYAKNEIVAAELTAQLQRVFVSCCDNVDSVDFVVLENALGLVTAVCLRNPDVSVEMVSSGTSTAMLSCMSSILELTDSITASTTSRDARKRNSIGKCLRQGCMSLRNIASRSPEIREVLVGLDAIQIIRNAQSFSPTLCQDVGDAAIRDLTSS